MKTQVNKEYLVKCSFCEFEVNLYDAADALVSAKDHISHYTGSGDMYRPNRSHIVHVTERYEVTFSEY